MMKKIVIYLTLLTFYFSLLTLFPINTVSAQVKPELHINIGHATVIRSVAVSPNGNYSASCDMEGLIKLWDLNSKKEIRTYSGHKKQVWSVAFSPNNKFIISGSEDSTIKIWSIYTGIVVKTLFGHNSDVRSVCYSPDGKYILSASDDNTVRIWDANSGIEIKVLTGHRGCVNFASFSPDGKLIVSGSDDQTVRLWDVVSGKELKVFKDTTYVLIVRFTPDGNFVLSSNLDHNIKKWDVKSGKEVTTFKGDFIDAYNFDIAKNGSFVASNDNSSSIMEIWDIETGKRIKTLKGHKLGIGSLCVSPDNKSIFCGGNDGTISLWNINNEKTEMLTESPGVPLQIKYARNGKYFLTSFNKEVIKYCVLSPKIAIDGLLGHDDFVESIDISDDCNFAISYSRDQTIKIWDLNEKKIIKNYRISDDFVNVNFLSNSNLAAYSVFLDGTTIFNIETGMAIKKFKGSLNSIFSPDGKYIVTENIDRSLKMSEVSSGKEIMTFIGNTEAISSIAFSKDQKYIVSGDEKGVINIWYTLSGELIKSIKGHKKMVMDIIFSDDNKSFVSISDNSINCWDFISGKLIWNYNDRSSIYSISYTPDNHYILTGIGDGSILFLNPQNGEKVLSLFLIGINDWCVTTPDGRFDASEGGIKQLYYVKGMEIIPLESFFEQYYTPNLLARVMAGEEFAPLQVNVADLKPAPLVKITTPLNNAKVNNEQITVTVDVTDMGGGIDEILLYHNGKLVQTTNRGFKEVEQKDTKSSKSFTITLSNGENKIKATAFNTQRTEAIPNEIIVKYEGVQVAKPNLYLLVIGIDEYKNAKYNLNFAIADASSFLASLQAGSQSMFGSVNTVFIKNTDATKANIIAELEKIKFKAQQQDMFVFYYAGHGAMSEEERSLFYLIPTDVTQMFAGDALKEKAVSATELKQFSTEIKAQKQVFILDACQSGGMEEVLAARGAAEEKAIAQLARSTGTYWLAASGSQQFASEFAQLKHGLFTYCILQALSGKADGQNDKKVTVQELSSYLNDQVPIISKQYKGSEQYPVTYGFGQDFPIVIVK